MPRPTLLILTLLGVGFMAMAESAAAETHLEFSTVPGYFLQDEPETDPETFDYVAANFGLIPRAYDSDAEFDPDQSKYQWERFAHHLKQLNVNSGPEISYKLLYLGRHGEGYHNVAERRYGTELWDCYWSLQDGDANGTWVDARLTPLGIAQAETAHMAWATQIDAGIPPPQTYYVSPLNRCLATASITFLGLKMPGIRPFRPVVKELLRETIGLHTCDARSPKSAIAAEYPHYIFEPGFADHDPLYDPAHRESNSARTKRLRALLSDICAFDSHAHTYTTTNIDPNTNTNTNTATILSLTAHSGAITSLLEVVRHRRFALATGAVLPVLVRVERVEGRAPEEDVEPPSGAPVCRDEVEVEVRGMVGGVLEGI